MMKIADSEKLEYDENRKKYLGNPEKTSLIRKKLASPEKLAFSKKTL